jgi:hypothetical protein
MELTGLEKAGLIKLRQGLEQGQPPLQAKKKSGPNKKI